MWAFEHLLDGGPDGLGEPVDGVREVGQDVFAGLLLGHPFDNALEPFWGVVVAVQDDVFKAASGQFGHGGNSIWPECRVDDYRGSRELFDHLGDSVHVNPAISGRVSDHEVDGAASDDVDQIGPIDCFRDPMYLAERVPERNTEGRREVRGDQELALRDGK